MVTPEEIKKKALSKYTDFLSSDYNEEKSDFFPLYIKCDKKLDSKDLDKSITELQYNSKLMKGFGYSVDWKTVNTKLHSNQNIPEKIYFETEYDFLKYIDKQDYTIVFRNITDITLLEFPELKDSLIKKHKLVVENKDKWDDILKVCRYFNVNHKPGKFVRELPIGVHTKFIEENKEILRVLLDIIVGEDVNKDAKTFYGRFNLKEGDPQISFRLLDKDFSVKYLSGFTYSSVFVCEFAKFIIPVRNVVIVENKHNMMKLIELFPEMRETIVVWGCGYKVTVLKDVPWLKDLKLYYWGDIDAQGYEILSDIRQYFPDIESIMMDEEALRIHPTKVDGTISNVKKEASSS